MQKSICASRVTWASGGSWLTRLPSMISPSLNHFVQSADAPARIGYWFGQCTSTDRNMRHKCIPQAIHFVPARQNWCKRAPLGHAFDSCFAGWNLTACCSMPCWRGKTDSPRFNEEYVIVLDSTIVIFFGGDAGTSVNFEDAAVFFGRILLPIMPFWWAVCPAITAASTPPPSPSFHPPLPQHMFEWVKCQVMLFREDLGDMSSYSGTNGARRFLSISNCTLPDEEISRSFSELADRIPTFKWPWKDTGRWCDMPCPPSSMAAMVVLCHRRPWSNCYHYDCVL